MTADPRSKLATVADEPYAIRTPNHALFNRRSLEWKKNLYAFTVTVRQYCFPFQDTDQGINIKLLVTLKTTSIDVFNL
jgi:hypothetical protein